MTKVEARREVILLYNTKFLKQAGGLETRNTGIGALEFYIWLKSNHPEVLTFPFDRDRYQIVKLWIGLP